MRIIFGIFIFTVIGVLEFFRFSIIPTPLVERIQFVMPIFCLCLLIVFSRYFRHRNNKQIELNFKTPIVLLLTGWILSMVVCQLYHGQNYVISLFATRLIFNYTFYFFLHTFRFDKELIIKSIIIIGVVALGVYFIQYTIYPTRILSTRMSIDRGTIRLFVPGLNAAIIIFFIYINQFFEKRKILPLIIAMICYSAFILQATRQIIFGIALLTVINIFISQQIRSRGLIIFLLGIGVVSVVFAFQELFLSMIELSQSQSSEGETTRTKTIRFFMTEFQTDFITYIFGNGEGHPASSYGRTMDMYKLAYNRYLNDIGILGDYVRYGVLFVIGGLMLMIKSFYIKVQPGMQVFKYYFAFLLLTSITSKGVFGTADVIMVMTLYVLDVSKYEHSKFLRKNKAVAYDGQ